MSTTKLHVNADLDTPGETRRQLAVFGIWAGCLALAVALTVVRRPTSSNTAAPIAPDRMTEHKRERLLIGAGLGVLLPALLCWWITHRRRRGGPHAKGIVIDVTDDAELRIWGRGYGQRVALPGARVSETLVDVYTGRMGAWRQRRLIVRAARPIPGMPVELVLATPFEDEDLDLDLPLIGGEGDCIEVRRADYQRVLEATRALASTHTS